MLRINNQRMVTRALISKEQHPLTMRYHGMNIALYRARRKRKIDRSRLAG
jgi:hypothetical protein